MPTQEELNRAFRRDVDKNAFEIRRHEGRLYKIELELASRYVVPVAPPPGGSVRPASPYRDSDAIDLSGHGPHTRSIMIAAVQEVLKQKSLEEDAGAMRELRGELHKGKWSLFWKACGVVGFVVAAFVAGAVLSQIRGSAPVAPTPHGFGP
jgi:hypothetical protein